MKKVLLIIGMAISSLTLWSQNHAFTIAGGYAWANIENTDNDIGGTGWRLNGLYEFIPNGGSLAQGLSFGYIGTSASGDTTLITGAVKEVDITINSWPIYYAPKFMFGNEKIKGFVNGALGFQFSTYKYNGPSGIETKLNDGGFYGGVGAGLKLIVKENIFINLEYQWAYMSNSYYRDGFINSAMGGIGMTF